MHEVSGYFGASRVGLLHLIRADTVLAYQRIRLFAWANSLKSPTEDYGEVKPQEMGGIPVEYVNRRREECKAL